MGKKSPRLTVLQGQARSEFDASNALEILSLGELNDAKSRRVEAIIGEFCPNAGVLGIAVTGRNWDLRPFVALSTEDGPSVIRFLGPEVSMCKSIQARTQDIFERMNRAQAMDNVLRDWGVYEEQLWYRRGLIDHTLGDLLAENKHISLSRATELCASVISTVALWHAEGILHGHISVDNIVVEGNNPVGLVDAGVGLALVQSSNSFGFVDFPTGYTQESFAPETLAGETLVSSSDVFGVARVIQAIVGHVDEHKLDGTERKTLRSLLQLAAHGVADDPTKRPSLTTLGTELKQSSTQGSPQPHKTVRERVAAKAPVRGKTIQPRKKGQRGRIAEPQVEKVAAEPQPIATPKPQNAPVQPIAVEQPTPMVQEPPVFNTAPAEPQPIAAPEPQNAPVQPIAVKQPAPMVQEPPVFNTVPAEPQPIAAPKPQNAPVQPSAVEQPAPMVQEPPVFNKAPVSEPAPISQPEAVQPVVEAAPPVLEPIPIAPRPTLDDQIFSGTFGNVTREPEPNPISEPSLGYSPAQMEAPVAAAPQLQPNTATVPPKTKEQSWTPFFIFMVLTLLVMHLLFDLRPIFNSIIGRKITPEYTIEDLQASWRSNDPSFMQQVVEAAINPESPNVEAQRIIVRSVQAGEESLPGMNINMLRVAFHDYWHAELTTADRQAALVFGLSEFLRANSMDIPDPLVALGDLNAGVILALTANASNIGTRKALSGIPLTRLTELQVPFGPAFKTLAISLQKADCSNAYVHMLARLLTVAPETIKALEIKQFVEGNTEAKLGALAIGFSQDSKGARKILNDLINHANIKVTHPYINWGRSEELINWGELVDNDKLFILAGFPPSQAVSPANLGRMFLHPSAAIRGYAFEHAIDLITFRHPAAVKILLKLKDNPALLNATQTFKLAVFLENPAKAKEASIQSWLKSNPSKEILEMMLLATVKPSLVDTSLLDFEIARHLQHNRWRFDIHELQQLVLHHDAFTRSFAYFETAKIRDRKTARRILESALAQETNINFRQQLESNIEALKASETILAP